MDMEMMTQCTECMGSGTILGTECGHCDVKILIDEVYSTYSTWNRISSKQITEYDSSGTRATDHIQIIGKDIVMTEFAH
jgi:DnaJ-class molecular chaperone